MDLEKLNKTYEKAKANLETKKKEIEKLGKNLKTELENIDIVKGAKIVAQRKNDADAIKRADEAIKMHQDNIKKIKEKTEEEKEEMQMFQEKVDKIIEEIKENPEMKQHLEQVLAKRYSRENKKVNKEIEEIEKKKEENAKKLEAEDKKIESIENVRQMIDAHKTMKNHMQGMLNASASIKKLNDELATLDMTKDKTRIKQIQKETKVAKQKLEKNRDGILTYASKNKLGITKEILEDIANNVVVDKNTDKVNVKASLSNTEKAIQVNKSKIAKQNKSYDRKVARCNEQISYNEKAMIKLGGLATRESTREPEPETESETETERTNLTGQTILEEMQSELARPESAQTGATQSEPEQAEKKLKWFQFIKKFKRLLENRKGRKMQALQEPEQSEQPEEVSKMPEEKGEFAQSLKYKVVQDLAKQMQQETIKEVKEERAAQENER